MLIARSDVKGTAGMQSQGRSWDHFWQQLPLNRLRCNPYLTGNGDVLIIRKPETVLRRRIKTGDKQQKACKMARRSIATLQFQATDLILLLS